MVRTPKIDKNGMKKGVWSQEEDDKLRAYVLNYGHFNWRQLPKFAGLSRCGKSCRLRWLNYLRQNVKRGDYTKEEEDLIINLRDQLGNRWSVIAAKLPGRTDNEIKNYWHSNLKKRVKQNPATSEVMDQSNDSSLFETNQKNQTIIATSEGNPLFPESSSSELSSISFDYAILRGINGVEEDCITSFESNPNELHVVTSPFQANQERGLTQEKIPESHFNGFPSRHFDHEQLNGINWLEDYGVITIENFWTEPFLSDESHNQTDVLSHQNSEGNPLFLESSSSGLSSLSFDYTLLSGINQIEEDCITSFESYSLSNPNEFHIENFPSQANQERERTLEKIPESTFNEFSSPYFDDEQLSGINQFKDYSIITPLESYSELIGNSWTEPFLLDESHNQSDFLQASTEGGFLPPLCSYYDDNI